MSESHAHATDFTSKLNSWVLTFSGMKIVCPDIKFKTHINEYVSPVHLRQKWQV